MPRFVILEHDHPVLHWDLMLEAGAALRTWRLAQAPSTTGAVIDAQALPDHRLEYLEYEGPVSGGRGAVKRWDTGAYETLSAAIEELRVRMYGARVGGVARLLQTGNSGWTFAWVGD
jgi:DNA polymerase Ligase (LigD)